MRRIKNHQVDKTQVVKSLIGMFMLLFILTFVPAVTAEAKWVKTSKGYRYTTDASGNKYYKNKWVKIKGKYYYFDKKGYRKTGWLTYKGKKYYLNKSGVRVTGFKNIKNKTYFFSKKGVMKTGWLKYENYYYYLNNKGVLQKGLTAVNNYVFYFDATGKRITSANIILGNMTYYFSANGTLQYTGSEEEQVVKYINIQRMLKGYEPLAYDVSGNLSKAVLVRAKELSEVASHTRPNGTGYSTVLSTDYPVANYWSGECILWGSVKAGTTVAQSWLSNQNAEILMQKEADTIAIAKYRTDNGYEYWSAIVIQSK